MSKKKKHKKAINKRHMANRNRVDTCDSDSNHSNKILS